MKKADTAMRAEYKRSDFAELERGKFFREASKWTPFAPIEPRLAKASSTSEAINEALRGSLTLVDETTRITRPFKADRTQAGGPFVAPSVSP